MILLAWTLLTASLWTSGRSQILQQEATRVLYPKLDSTETIDCHCVNVSCDLVYWFRSVDHRSTVEYLGKCNNAEKATYGPGVDEARFRMNKRSTSFTLRIVKVTEEDTGIYSCVLKCKNTEVWKSGVLLRPGVIPPTLPPVTKPKPPVKSVCHCSKKKSSRADGCGSLILWPLVGLIAATALALVCTLYYFSRLPKKCRHFVRRR